MKLNTQLPPKHNFNASFNYDWDIMNKKREIEMLRPKEIFPKRNHSFHTSSNDCDKSIHNRSFEKSMQETEKVSSRMQNEFGQLKTLIQKRRDEIEKQQRQQNLKLSISIPLQNIKEDTKKQKEEAPQFNYYQTFKPIFAKLNSLIENSNTKEQDRQRLVTLFDSIDQESIKKNNEPEQMFQLVEQLVKEFVIPTLEQQTPSQQNSKRSYLQTQSSNFIKQLPSHQQIPKSIEQSINYKNVFELQYKNPFQFYTQIKNNDCGYYEYCINNKIVIGESLNSFNISKSQSCILKTQCSNIQVDYRQIKQSLIQQQIFSIDDQFSLVPVIQYQSKVIYALNYPSQYCKQIQQYISLNISNYQYKMELAMNKLNKIVLLQQRLKRQQVFSRLNQFMNQLRSLKRLIQQLGFKKLKQNYYQTKFQKSTNNNLCKLLLQAAKQVKKDQKNYATQLFMVLQKYQCRLKSNAITQLIGNDDLIIMLQALQSENSIEMYLQQVAQLMGEKLAVSILNIEIQSLTSYLPEYGLIQEYFEDIDDISQFNTLYQLTLNINTELMNNQNIEFENRHIWKVNNEIFLITSSNMQTHYLSKIALILTNGINSLRQKYLEFFKFIRIRAEQYQQKMKSKFFNRWRNNQSVFLDKLRNELGCSKQEQDQQQRLIYQYELELQNMQIQNALKSKCLSSAMLENTLSKRENELSLKETFFKLWRSRNSNRRHFEQRVETGLFLLESAIYKIEQCQLDKAFREIAFSYTQPNGIIPTSPNLKNTKRSYHTREQTRRSQEELEQSVLWDVHQMKIHTPNAHKGQSLSPITAHTINQSFLLENESLYQYHSQRCTQQPKKKAQQQQSSHLDQENVQSQNKIYSQRTKDFVRKISQPKQQQQNHRRINSTQPGSSFSFYDLQH
ncbi:unnamed protein product [Paramecium primaurelia]|uniref:Uncharacterized protein n=1 Tax=Paramecium primaurelia TaxID=5886 RepID=A0A8S1LL73_PARPR|nr:unnamed protein product [Paramecium primaurelia]